MSSPASIFRDRRPEPPASPEGARATPSVCLGSVFRSMRDGIVVRGIEDQIIEHNPAAERLLGLSFDQIRGQAPLDPGWRLIQTNGRDFPQDQTPTRLTLGDGQPRHGVIIGLVATGADLRWLSFNSDPLHDSNGRLIAAVATFSDVTAILVQGPEFNPAPTASPAADASTPRPTLAMIARRLGVSTAAVSMALRNHPRISPEMREKAKAVAEELGYRSDPHVRRAMTRLRLGSRATARANLCALGDPSSFTDPFVAALIAAAAQRADALGYGFSAERIEQLNQGLPALTRTLVHRGVDGLLLLPRSTPWDCEDLLVWPRFSVVAASHGVRGPDFDRVTVDWFSAIRGTCAELAGRGYRRIGAVIDTRVDELGGHKILAALAGIHLHLPLERAPVFHYRTTNGQMLASAPPFGAEPMVEHRAGRAAFPSMWQDLCHRLKEWHRRERPDALVIDSESTALAVLHALGLAAPADLGVAVLNRRADSQFAGWEERPMKVGEVAIELLDSKVRQAERGAPAMPSINMIKGIWRDGPSVRERLRPAAGNGELALFPGAAALADVSRGPG